MPDTARDIITESLLDLGILAEGETPTAIQANGALKKLNAMLDSWSLDNLLIYGMTTSTLPMVANKQVYTIGVGGDLNIPRPNNIISCSIIDTSLPLANRVEYNIPMYSNQEWAEVYLKGLTAAFPAFAVYFDYDFPFIQANMWPVPDSSQYSLIVYQSGILSNFNLDDNVSLPSGYRRALVSNLSIELSPSYGAEVSQVTAKIAMSSLKLLMSKNLQVNELKSNDMRYNIYTDSYK